MFVSADVFQMPSRDGSGYPFGDVPMFLPDEPGDRREPQDSGCKTRYQQQKIKAYSPKRS